MSGLIPDGVYKIRNSQPSDYVADLLNGNQLGPICAHKDSPANRHDKWRIQNIGYGAVNNLITIENVHTSGSYAYAEQSQGASLVGSYSATVWTVVALGDAGKYCIQSPNSTLVWELYNGDNNVNIKLVHHTAKENTKWSFEPVRLPVSVWPSGLLPEDRAARAHDSFF